MKASPKRKYAPEFRDEAVKLVQSGVSPAELARRLGTSLTTLSGWCLLCREGRMNATERNLTIDKDQEIARVMLENAELKMDCHILRKAPAYFVKEGRRGTPSFARSAPATRSGCCAGGCKCR